MKTGHHSLVLDDLIISIVLILPFFRYYEIPGLNIGFETAFSIALLVFGGLCAVTKKHRGLHSEMKSSRNWFVLFLGWLIAITLFYELFTSISVLNADANYNMFALVMPVFRAFFILILLGGYVKTDKCIKTYRTLVYIVAAVYILQWCLFVLGIRVSFKMPFAYEASWDYMYNKVFGMNGIPTSLFSERSHMCEFLIPYVVMCLFSKEIITRNRIRQAVFFTLLIVSSGSGNGVVLAFIVWALYFLIYGEFKKPQYKSLIVILGIVVLVAGFFILNSIPRFNEMFSRLFINSTGSEYVSSKADYRIYRGFDIFFKLPGWAILFGVGYKHMFLFSREYGIVSQFDYGWQTYEYFSAISMVMIYGGLIGAFAFIKHLWAFYRTRINSVRGLIIIMMALCFSTEMLFNSIHLMYITLLIALFSKEKMIEKAI